MRFGDGTETAKSWPYSISTSEDRRLCKTFRAACGASASIHPISRWAGKGAMVPDLMDATQIAHFTVQPHGVVLFEKEIQD